VISRGGKDSVEASIGGRITCLLKEKDESRKRTASHHKTIEDSLSYASTQLNRVKQRFDEKSADIKDLDQNVNFKLEQESIE
jgi:hypothetical protein